jgi:hypothetical protein
MTWCMSVHVCAAVPPAVFTERQPELMAGGCVCWLSLVLLLLSQEPRCCGLVLLDPVDRADVPLGPGYPSALPDLTAATRSRWANGLSNC